jgi:hypothetical protein
MTVKVELFGQLGISREKNQSFEIEAPLPVSEVAELAGVQVEEIGLATINGVQVPLTELVPVTCRLSLFSPMSGG